MTIENKVRKILEQAHMAGQADAGVDPSYSNARVYCDKVLDKALKLIAEAKAEGIEEYKFDIRTENV